MKVSELEGEKLDFWVAKASQGDFEIGPESVPDLHEWWKPSSNWAQGGPIIERERIDITSHEDMKNWVAQTQKWTWRIGSTPLIAAMRCFVANTYGPEVPDE